MMNKARAILFLLIFCLLFIACAQVRSINGGEKDLVAPKLLNASPPSASLHFNSNTIVLNFDEYIQLNNISQELIVSPPLAHPPKVKVKHKSVVVELEEDLIPNTTYMFNFGDGIIDVNENNKATDMVYVFSTGNFIDSLEVQGAIQNAFEDSPYSGIKVMLFENDSDFFSKKTLPLYFSKTKEDGTFVLPYLREGNFFIYALDDENSNYKWDAGEAFATSDSDIHVSANDSINHLLFASVPLPAKPTITDYKTDSTGTLSFTLDSHFHPVEVASLSGHETIQYSEGDSIFILLNATPANKVEQLRIFKKDVISDTVDIPFFSSPFENAFELTTRNTKKMRVQDSLLIHCSQLVKVNDMSALQLKQDSLLISSKLIATQNPSNFLCDAKLLPGKNFTMRLIPGALINSFGATNDTLDFSFSTFRKEELGLLQFELTQLDSTLNYHFFLFEKSGLEYDRKFDVKNGVLQISDLPAGDYTAKILSDKNNNRLFDPAKFEPYTPSELMYVFPEKISVRANWEVKLKWVLK
jgi:hypothetical protein